MVSIEHILTNLYSTCNDYFIINKVKKKRHKLPILSHIFIASVLKIMDSVMAHMSLAPNGLLGQKVVQKSAYTRFLSLQPHNSKSKEVLDKAISYLLVSIEADLAKVGMSYDTRTRVLEVAPGGNSMPITPFVKKVCTPLGRIRDVIW